MWLKFALWLLKHKAPVLFNKLNKKEDEHEGDRLHKTFELIEKARIAIETAHYRNYTTLEIFDTEDESYLCALKEIWDSKQFAFFIDVHKNVVISNIMAGDEKAALEGQGILKGIDYIMKNLFSAKGKYLQLKQDQNIGNEQI